MVENHSLHTHRHTHTNTPTAILYQSKFLKTVYAQNIKNKLSYLYFNIKRILSHILSMSGARNFCNTQKKRTALIKPYIPSL